jgi:hypothetical protein
MPANSFVQTLEINAKDNATQALNTASSSAQKAAGSFDTTNKSVVASGKAAEQSQSKFTKFGTTMQSNVGSITAVTGSAWGLFNAFDDMEKKVLATNRAQTMAERSALMLSKQQDKLQKIASKSGKGSQEYATQLEVVRLAQDKVTQTGEKAKIMAGDLQESYAQLAMTAGPMAAALGGSVAQMVGNFSKMGPAAGGAAQAVSGIAPAANKAGLAMKLLHFAMGPVGIILLAVGALFALYATNAWGFADAVNGVAKSILGAIQGVIGAVQTAFAKVSNFIGAFMKDILSGNIPAALNRIKTLILGIYTEWIKPTFDKIAAFIMDKLNIIASAFRDPIGTAKTLITGLLDFIFTSFQTIGPAVIGALSTLNTAINDAVQAAIDAFIGFGEMLLPLLTELFTVTIPALLLELGELILAEVTTWPDKIMDALTGLAEMFASEGPKWLEGIKKGFLALIGWIGAEAPKIGQKIIDELLKIDWAAAWDKLVQSVSNIKIDGAAIWKVIETAFWAMVDHIKSGFTWEKLAEGFKFGPGFFLGIQVDWEQVWNHIKSGFTWEQMIAGFKMGPGFFLGLKVDWDQVWNSIKAVFTWENISAGFKIVGNFFDPLGINAQRVVDAIKTIFTWENIASALKVVTGIFNPLAINAQQVVDGIKSIFTWQNLAAALKVVGGIFDPLGINAQQVVDSIKSIFTWENLAAALKVVTNIFNPLGINAQQVVDSIKSIFTWENLSAAAKPVTDFFGSVAHDFDAKVIQPIKKTFTWENISKTFAPATNLFSEIAHQWDTNVTQPIQKAFTWENITKFFKPATDLFGDVGKTAQDFIMNFGKVGEAYADHDDDAQKTKEKIQELHDKLYDTKPAAQAAADALKIPLGAGNETRSTFEGLNVVMDNFAKNSAASLQEFKDKGKASLDEVTLAVNKFGDDLIKKTRESTVALMAQNTFWKLLPESVSAYLSELQKVALENINVKQALTDTNFAQYTYNQGQIEGKTAVKDFVDELVKGMGAHNAQIKSLESLASGFGGLPGFIEPTIENYKAFIAANVQGGEATQKFREIAINSWSTLTSAASSMFSGMIGIFRRSAEDIKTSGEGMGDAWKKELDKIPEAVKATLSPEELGLLKLDAEFAAAGQNAAEAFAANLQANRTKGFDAALQLAGEAARGIIQGFVDKHPEFADEAQVFFDALGSGSATGVQKALDELSKMPGPFGDIFRQMKDSAAAGLDGIPGTIDDKVIAPMQGIEGPAGQAGAASGIALSQEFAAAGTHIAAVIKGIQANINSIKQGKVPSITINIARGLQIKANMQKAIDALKQNKIPSVTINISRGLQIKANLQNAINAIKQQRIPSITVNISAALSNIAKVKNGIANIKGKTVYIDVRQRAVGPKLAATGFHGEVNQPTMMMVGEQGRERVTVEPISTANSGGGTKGGYSSGAGGGGGQPMKLVGDLYFDTYKVGRIIGRAIAENNV